MRKLAVLALVFMLSCSPEQEDCNCGTITEKIERFGEYFIYRNNDCLGENERAIQMLRTEWGSLVVGDRYCD